ncbi:MAG: hypothetical protein WAU15_02725 [Nitrosomonas sp.]
MQTDLLESFESLLDTEYQHHIIAVMNEWCGNTHAKLNAAHADLVDKEISYPLRAWIDETQSGMKAGNYSDIETAQAFSTRADEIVYILRYNTRPLYPEHVAMLNDTWSHFQRSLAHSLHIKNRILKGFIDAQPSIENAVAEELQRRADEERRKSEEKISEGRRKWQAAGADRARKYTENNEQEWLKAGKRILKENREIKSARQLAYQIGKEGKYPPGAWETIRKKESFIKLFKEHKLNKNIR